MTSPAKSTVHSDLRDYFFSRPSAITHVDLPAELDLHDIHAQMARRLGMSVADYSVLNIHEIDIDVPTDVVWAELTRWGPNSGYWPDAVATVEVRDDERRHLEMFLVGRKRSLFGLRNGFLGLNLIPLFRMELLAVRHTPADDDNERGRFFIYGCSGGYPIGILAIYLRERNHERLNRPVTQVFFAVAFDFFGRKRWPRAAVLVRRVWELVHNRVTANVLNRLKIKCESQVPPRPAPPRV